MAQKIDSNSTGLRYAEESTTIKTLPGSPVWRPVEPNGYNDFGGQVTTVARRPINPNRQQKKGVLVGLDASGGWGSDFTPSRDIVRLLQGFLYADIREKGATLPLNGSAVTITDVDSVSSEYTAAAGLTVLPAGAIVLASGFTESANNGIKTVVSTSATDIVVNETLVDETPTSAAQLQVVGHQFGSVEMEIIVSGTYPELRRVSGSKDLTDFGLLPGEWIFVGGDDAGTAFAESGNTGFARVRSVTSTSIFFDKTSATMVAGSSTGISLQIFFGNVIRNEPNATDIVRRSYQLERTLGEDDNGTMSEYIVGAVPSEFSLQIRQEDKVTADFSFTGLDNEQRDGTTGVKSGDRPTGEDVSAFNTSSDFSRIKMSLVDEVGNTNPDPLFAFFTELTLNVNNNVSVNKAVGTLGGFDVTTGLFQVSGNVNAYFSDTAAVQAVRNNSNVTLDFVLVSNNTGILFDVPLIALGEGRLAVEQDAAITLPLSVDAAQGLGDTNHTLLINEFPYLPTVAG